MIQENNTNSYTKVNWKDKTYQEIYEYFDDLESAKDQALFLIYMVKTYPDLEVGYLELMEDTSDILLFQNEIELIERMANTFNDMLPEEYFEDYEFMERRLIEYYFFQNNIEKILERLEIIKKNPAKGIDTITIKCLYLLIYHGYYQEAYNFSTVVWKPIYDSDEVIENSYFPFVTTIYLFELEKNYENILKNQSGNWDALRKKMNEMDFEEEPEILNFVIRCIENELDKEEFNNYIVKKNHRFAHTMINIYFLKFMKEKFQISFMHSDLLFNLLSSENLYKNKKNTENYFLFSFKELDKHISSRFDSIYLTNLEELYGKVFGLEYVFHFFHSINIINEDGYNQMQEIIQALQYLFICITDSDLWKMTFVLKWPKWYAPDPSKEKIYNLTFKEDVKDIDIAFDNYKKLLYITLPEYLKKEVNAPDEYPDYGEPLFNFGENESMFDPGYSDYEITEPYVKENPDIGRNDPCPCGSGKKYKKCCLIKV